MEFETAEQDNVKLEGLPNDSDVEQNPTGRRPCCSAV
jgi:hypothetical protein